MTTEAKTPLALYDGDGISVDFEAKFRFLAGTLVVEVISADGDVTALVPDTNYTVTGGDTDAGGAIILTSGGLAPAGTSLRIRRDTVRKQTADYDTNDTFPAETHEGALDRLSLITQELDVANADTAGRAFLVPAGEVASVLPPATERTGGKLWGWDSATGEFALRDGSDFKGDPGGNVESVGKFATVAAQSISTGATSIRVSDRGQAVLAEVPLATVYPASGQGKWWTLSNGGGRKWVIASKLSSSALGAVIDGGTSDTTILKELVEVAGPTLGRAVYISPGTHAHLITTAADVIYPKANSHIVFEPGAKIKGAVNIGGAGYYLPFFAIISKNGVVIEGANDKQFVFTNRLTYGAGQDFPTVDPTSTGVTDTRLSAYGQVSAARADSYSCGILTITSHNVTLQGLGCQSVDGSAVALGAAFCHTFIGTSGNCNSFWYDNIDVDDVVIGCAVQGGDGGGYGGYIRGGRMSQDIGIPGHVRYDFRRNCVFGPTVDTGEETGADLTRQISHTVSCAGSGPVAFGPIVSRRRHGPLNIKDMARGGVFSGIAWFPQSLRAGGSEILPDQARIYGVTGSSNTGIRMPNIMLDANGADVILVGGDFGKGSVLGGTLVRNDTAAPTYGYLAVGGGSSLQRFDFNLVQKGTFDPPSSIHCVGVHTDSRFNLNIEGFIGNAPKVQMKNGASYIARSTFVIGHRYDATGFIDPAFGDPADIWVGATVDSDRASNIMMYPDGWSRWEKIVAAGTTYTARFPLHQGTFEAKVALLSSLYTTAAYFEHIEMFEGGAQRTKGRGGSAAIAAATKGTVFGVNNTAYTAALTPALGYCDVAGNIVGASPQGSTSVLQFSSRVTGGPN